MTNENTTMEAVVLHKNGDPTTADVISVVTCNIPTPSAGQILVKVHAAALNPIDWKWASGVVPGKTSGPVGCDVSGVVEQVGPGVAEHRIGDEVYADAVGTMGSFAEYCIVLAADAKPKPASLSFRESAALPLAGLTALQGLTTHGGLKKGGRVAIYGGSGGVGSLAVQMAKALEAEYIVATGSSEKFIKDLGADTVINYKEQSIEDGLRGKNLDLVFDCVGGYEGWKAAQGGLKREGKYVTIAGVGGHPLQLDPEGPSYKFFLTDEKNGLDQISEWVDAGKVRPLLDDRVFKLTTESVHDLIKASRSNRTKGKLVISVVS